jgi:hypothetical protein
MHCQSSTAIQNISAHHAFRPKSFQKVNPAQGIPPLPLLSFRLHLCHPTAPRKERFMKQFRCHRQRNLSKQMLHFLPSCEPSVTGASISIAHFAKRKACQWLPLRRRRRSSRSKTCSTPPISVELRSNKKLLVSGPVPTVGWDGYNILLLIHQRF